MFNVTMRKTLAPLTIPNGTNGKLIGPESASAPGLHLAEFNGIRICVYLSEIEITNTPNLKRLVGALEGL